MRYQLEAIARFVLLGIFGGDPNKVVLDLSPEFEEAVRNALTTLSPRKEKVLALRWGLADGIQHSRRDIAARMPSLLNKNRSISPERVRQIEAAGLRMLRHPIRARFFRHHVSDVNPQCGAKSLRPCPACRVTLVREPGPCEACRAEGSRRHGNLRRAGHGPDHSFYHSAQWTAIRAAHLQREELCRRCTEAGLVTLGYGVNHIIPRSAGGPDTDDNLETLCKGHMASADPRLYSLFLEVEEEEMPTDLKTQRKAIRPSELARILSISRAYAYVLVRSGAIRAVRAGRAWLVPLAAVDEYLAKPPDGNAP